MYMYLHVVFMYMYMYMQDVFKGHFNPCNICSFEFEWKQKGKSFK